MSRREFIRLLEAQCKEPSRSEVVLEKEVKAYFKKCLEDRTRVRNDIFNPTDPTGYYAINMKSGGPSNVGEYPWLKNLGRQVVQDRGCFLPLVGAAGGGGGAGGPAAAAQPNAWLDGRPYTIAFQSGKRYHDDEDDEFRPHEIKDILKLAELAFDGIDGTLKFTFDNIESRTDRFAISKARELNMEFNTDPKKAPSWYNEMMGRDNEHNRLVHTFEARKAQKAVSTYNDDETSSMRALRRSMIKDETRRISGLTERCKNELAASIVERVLQSDSEVPLGRALPEDNYLTQFGLKQHETTLPPPEVELAPQILRQPVLPVLQVKNPQFKSRLAVSENHTLIVTLANPQEPTKTVQGLKKEFKKAGLRAQVKLVKCERRGGLPDREQATPKVVVTANTASELWRIRRWFQLPESHTWLVPRGLSITEEDNALVRMIRQIPDDSSDEDDDTPLASLKTGAALPKTGALTKSRRVLDSDDEADEPSPKRGKHTHPGATAALFAKAASEREPAEVMPDESLPKLLETGKKKAPVKKVLAAIDIEDTADNQVLDTTPIGNTAGNTGRGRIPTRKVPVLKYKKYRMGWWEQVSGDPKHWQHVLWPDITTEWVKKKCIKDKRVIWESSLSGKITTECPWPWPARRKSVEP